MDKILKKVDHIAIAVKSLDSAVKFYKDIFNMDFLGYEEVESQKIKAAIFDQKGVRIEFLEPTSDSSPISKFLEKKGQGLHHICYEVEDIEVAVKTLKEMGAKLLNEKPTPGAHNTKVVFLHPKNAGHLIELNQHQK